MEHDCHLTLKKDGNGCCHSMKLSTHYGCTLNITLWENDKQPTIRGHDLEPHNPTLVPLSLEELCDLERIYNYTDSYVYDINNRLMSILWKAGGEGNPIKSSQTRLVSDVHLEMHCLQVIHRIIEQVKYIQNG